MEFKDGLSPISHGVVAVEVFQPVDLQPDADKLPLEYHGVPITYLSVNDFLNLTVLLRSMPELMEYLAERRTFPPADLRLIGDEETLFSFYLLNDGSFAGCAGRADARNAVAAQQDRLKASLKRKFEADRYAFLLEHVADELAERNPHYADDLPPHILAAYAAADARRNYIEMQAALADLRLRERAELGRALHGAEGRVEDKGSGFTFRTARFDSMPEWVYVVGAARGVDRTELFSRMFVLMRGAMAFYDKPQCLVVVDREKSYEVTLSRPHPELSPADLEAGKRLFGELRVISRPLHFSY